MAQLLTAPGPQLRQDLQEAHGAIAAAFPLKSAHRNELPYAVRDLSRLLTQDRAQSQGYWAQPRLVGAYLYYFLPWNLQRLAWLLPGLPLDLRAGDHIMDLGSGPLTLPLALWLCRPELRALPLQLLCSDLAPRPMELGRATLDALAAAKGVAPWQTSLLRGPLDVALRKAKGKMRLIMAGNVLNELPSPRRSSLEERLAEVIDSMGRLLAPGGQILLMEPGTRLGGKLIGLMRQTALEYGFTVEAPCPHLGPCPFVPQNRYADDETEDAPTRHREGYMGKEHAHSGWCHFSIQTGESTPELDALTRAAKLEKERLHLSCLLLRKEEKAPAPRAGQAARLPAEFNVRVISDIIRLPGQPPARYACSPHGLALLQNASQLQSGESVKATLPTDIKKDPKSGALFVQIKK